MFNKPYEPSEGVIYAFTQGDCWRLALAMRDLTGLPLAFATPGLVLNDYWVHVGLKVGEKILDIKGLHSAADWGKEWVGDNGHVFYASSDEDVEALTGMQYSQFSTVRAPAKKLLKRYAPEYLMR